ncbi:MAG TPA: hypothetical protein VGM90_15495 [Kofleriaceae bacterium]|jgi:hypothetical protein
MRAWTLALIATSGCRGVLGIEDPTIGDDTPVDAMSMDTGGGSDAPAGPTCLDKWKNGTVQLTTPAPVLDTATIAKQFSPWVSDDELELWFTASVGSGSRQGVFRATRASTSAMFTNPTERGDLDNNNADNFDIELSSDGLTAIVANQDRTDGPGLPDLFLATRASTSANFGALSATPLGGVDTINFEIDSALSRDGLRLYFTRITKGTSDPAQIYISSRASTSAAFGTPTLFGFGGGNDDSTPGLSADETVIVWSRGESSYNLYYATRATTSATFGSATAVPIVATGGDDGPFLSADSCTLYFRRNDGGATIPILAAHVIL